MKEVNNNAIDMTATENENNNAISEMEMMDNLKGERDALLDKVGALEAKLKEEKEDRCRIYDWYLQEKDKVRALSMIIRAMKSEYVSIDMIVDRIVKAG